MPELAYDNIIQDLQNKIYYPVYLLSGEESYFIDSISNYMEENILDAMDREFNQTIVYGLDTNITSLINLARSYPMSANYQVIIVKEAQNLKEMGEMLKYFENPSESTILIFAYKHKDYDKRKAVYKAIKKTGVIFHSKKIWENKVPSWIQTQLAKNSYKIPPREAALLADYLGNSLSKINSELNKLTINLKKGTTITPEIIEENIGISKDFNVFSLTDALAAKDILKANQIVQYFIGDEKNHSIHALLPMMHSFFYKSLVYYQLENKTDKKNVAAKLGVHPFTVDRYIQCAKNFKAMKLFAIIGYLKDADLKAKGVGATSNTSNGEILKELIYKILH
jgi:DNA polymerase-3 subunit delta